MPMLEMFFVHRTCARDITCVPPHAYMPHRAYTRDICVQPRLEVRVSTLFHMQASIMPTCQPCLRSLAHIRGQHTRLSPPQSISYDERDSPFKKEQWVIFYNLFWCRHIYTSSCHAFKSIILQEYGQYMPIMHIYP